jgi:PAS domain S-box-containing protein
MSEAPRGDIDFAARHRLLIWMLWLLVPVLGILGFTSGAPTSLTVLGALCPAVFAFSAISLPTRALAAIATSLGLVASSVVVAGNTGVSNLSTALFLLALVAIAWYRMTMPLLSGMAGSVVALLLLQPEADPVALALEVGVLVGATMLILVGWGPLRARSNGDAGADLFRLGFDQAPIGMAVLRPSGEFLEVNTALADLVGYHPQELVGTNLSRLVHGDDQADLGEAWEEMGNSKSRRASEWMRLVTDGGKQMWGRLSLSLVPGKAGQQALVILQVEDASSTYEERHRLESLLRGKDEFVATLSDEIRQPLNLLIDLTDLADHSHVSSRETIPRIGAHAREIATIVDDLVVSARADTAPVSVVAQTLDSEAICREVLAAFGESGVVATDLQPLPIWADPDLTKQILRSLLGNAIRYGGAAVALRNLTSGPDTVIQVRDNGSEIPEMERERIFSGDLRSGQPVTRPAAVGLGLTVGRHLARQMDGEIEYRRSEGENLFELRLPSEQIVPRPRKRPSLRAAGG